jgi:hypothetical protein
LIFFSHMFLLGGRALHQMPEFMKAQSPKILSYPQGPISLLMQASPIVGSFLSPIVGSVTI